MGMPSEFTKLLDSLVIGYFGRQKYFLTAKSLLEESHSLSKGGPSNIEDTLHGANLEQIIETFQKSGDFRVPPFFAEFGVHLQQLTSEYFSYLVDHPSNRSHSKNQRMLYGRNVSRRNVNSASTSTLQNSPNQCHSPSTSNAPLSASSSKVHILMPSIISNNETQSTPTSIYIAQLVDNNGNVVDQAQQMEMSTVTSTAILYENDNTPASTNNDSSGCQENFDIEQTSSINLIGERGGSNTTMATPVEQRSDIVTIYDDGADSSSCSKTSSSLENHSLKRKAREPISLQQRLRHGLFAPDTVHRLAQAANTNAVLNICDGDCKGDLAAAAIDADVHGAHSSEKAGALPSLQPTRSLLSCIDNTLEKYMNPDNVQDFLANFNFEDDNWFAEVDDISNVPSSCLFKDSTDHNHPSSTGQILLESLDVQGRTTNEAEKMPKMSDRSFKDMEMLEVYTTRTCSASCSSKSADNDEGHLSTDTIIINSPIRRRQLVVVNVDDKSPPPPEDTRVEIIDEDRPCVCRDCTAETVAKEHKAINEDNQQPSLLPLNLVHRPIVRDKQLHLDALSRQKLNQPPPQKRRRNDADREWSLVPLSPIAPPRWNYDCHRQATLEKPKHKSQNSSNGKIASSKSSRETRRNDSREVEDWKRRDRRSDYDRHDSSLARNRQQRQNGDSRKSRSELNGRRDINYVCMEQKQGNNRRGYLANFFGEADKGMSKTVSLFEEKQKRKIERSGKKPPKESSVVADRNKENALPSSLLDINESRELVRIKIGRTDSPFRVKITQPSSERPSPPVVRQSIAAQTLTVSCATSSAQTCPIKVSTSTQV